ncbi:MAG TPA: GspH/FimT family pseudopilin [Caldimonas sp.]|nr:GspH/FimT family pseudopilin [Caldimonas sp.]HEV7574678.1 GspH/FimT family pseudopilin [Caldimonas sp.]
MRRENLIPCGPDRIAIAASSARRAAGFSLIEMLTTMSILAILLAIASPGLASLTSANALSAAQGELASAMVLARGEAIKRGTTVGLAATNPAVGAEFSGGWTVFVDANGNGIFDTGETIVRQQPAFHGDLRLGTNSGATVIEFNGRGFLTPSAMVTFTVCSTLATKSYQVRLEPVGLADVIESSGCP